MGDEGQGWHCVRTDLNLALPAQPGGLVCSGGPAAWGLPLAPEARAHSEDRVTEDTGRGGGGEAPQLEPMQLECRLESTPGKTQRLLLGQQSKEAPVLHPSPGQQEPTDRSFLR